MNIEEAVIKACQEPTLLDALTFICIWESERAIKQARFNYGSGSNGAGWDTCFKVCLESVMNTYPKRLKMQLIDRGDGVKDHFCIGRPIGDTIYWEFYNYPGKWSSAGDIFIGRDRAEIMLKALEVSGGK